MLHVHDLVDYVSEEAKRAGENAAAYLGGKVSRPAVTLAGRDGVRYTVPQKLDPAAMDESVTVRFRVAQQYRDADLCVWYDGACVKRIHKKIMAPGEMEQFTLRRESLPAQLQAITFTIEEGAK